MNKEMKILVTGAKGQLGSAIVQELKKRGYKNIFPIDKDDLDISHEEEVNELVLKLKPDVIMHNAAYTQVDKAEKEQELVYKINVLGSKYLAYASKIINAKFVFISTDYVFDGKGNNFYEIDDKKNTLSVYGKSKSCAEDIIINLLDKYFIVRTSWVFSKTGNNFINTILKLISQGKKELNVVSDQIGSPTYADDLANLLINMIESEKYGIYHATNEGICSWAELALFVVNELKLDVKINFVSTKEYEKLVLNQAKRPLNSRLSKKSLLINGFSLLPSWQDAVRRCLNKKENN